MAKNLTKRDIVFHIQKKTGLPQKQIIHTVQMILDVISESLANGFNVELRGFGSFKCNIRQERIGRNPNRPRVNVKIPRRAAIKFKESKALRAALNEINLDLF